MPRKTKSNISQKSRRSRMQCQRRQKRKDAKSQLQPNNNFETCIHPEPEPSKATELTDSTMTPHIKRSKVTTAARKMRLKREKEAQAPRDANPKLIKREAQAPKDKNPKLIKRGAQAPKDKNPPLKLINPWLRGALGPSSAFRCELTARPFRYDPDADSSNSEAALSDAHKDDAEDDNDAEATDEAYINAYDAKPSKLNESLIHSGFRCNVCHNEIIGYRYTCLQCVDWDMCSVCEAKGQHPEHYVLRLPAPKAEEESEAVLAAIRKHIDDLLNLKNEIHGIVIKHEVPEMGEDLDIDIKESNIDNNPKKILEFNVNPDSVTVNMVNSTAPHDNQLSKSSDAVTIRVKKEPNDGLSSTNETSTNYCEVSNSVNLSTTKEMSREYCEVSKYAKSVNRKKRRIEETSPNYCEVSNKAINVNTDCSIKTETVVKLKKVVLYNTFLSSTSEISPKESQVSNNATNVNTDCSIKTEKVIKLKKVVLNNTFLSSMNETSPKESQVSNNATNVNTDWSTKTETSSKYCEDRNNVKNVNTDGSPKNETSANHCEVSNSTNDVNTDLSSTNETSPDYCEVSFNTNSVNT